VDNAVKALDRFRQAPLPYLELKSITIDCVTRTAMSAIDGGRAARAHDQI
jgi:hypothetical protein